MLQLRLPDVDHHQECQHRQKQQGGDGVDLRGNAALGHTVDGHGQGGGGGTGGEVGDDEVVHAHGEGDKGPGDDARLDLREDHLPERLHPGTAQVLGRVHQVFVHLPQAGGDVEDHVGDVEGHMGQQEGAEPQGQAGGELHGALHAVEPPGEAPPALEEGHKEQAQAHAGDDVGIHHGDVVDHQDGVPLPAAEAVEADGGEGPGGGGDHRGQEAHQQGHVEALHDEPVLEELPVPVEREAPPHGAGIPSVEGEDDEQDDGQVQEEEHQADQKAAPGAVSFFHLNALLSLPCGKPG